MLSQTFGQQSPSGMEKPKKNDDLKLAPAVTFLRRIPELPILILVEKPTILTKVFYGFPQFIQVHKVIIHPRTVYEGPGGVDV
jgi:hypothetical protein